VESADPSQQLEIVSHELAEPDAGIDDDALARDPCGGASRYTCFQEFKHLDKR
jgi:hypothetical protein